MGVLYIVFHFIYTVNQLQQTINVINFKQEEVLMIIQYTA